MIYHVTYGSGEWKVKGYLGLPRGYQLSLPDWHRITRQLYGCSELPIRLAADSLPQQKKDIGSQKLPALLYCRGGMGKIGRVKTHWIDDFLRAGAVVFAPAYRGNEGGEGRDEFGGEEQEDVFAAYRLLQALPFVDAERISVMGFSRGGINATQLAAGSPGVHRLILWSSVTDLSRTYDERVDMRRMLKRVLRGAPAKQPDAYLHRSPIAMAERIACPVLLMHGTQDPLVDVSHSLHMYRKLSELRADVTLHLYQGYEHLFPSPMHEAAVDRMFDWISRPST